MPAIYIPADDENGDEIPEAQDMEDCFTHFASACRQMDLTRDAEGKYTDSATAIAWDAFKEGWNACQGY